MTRPFLILFALLVPAAAAADIVHLTNGHTIRVEFCEFQEEIAILYLPGGGMIRTPRAQVAEIQPELREEVVSAAREQAHAALARSPWSRSPSLGRARLDLLIDHIAREVGVDRRLAHAVIATESAYNPLAISPKGAMGLMQLMPATAGQYGVSDPFDPRQNLEAGMRHLRGLLRRFDLTRAVAAYNAGEGAVIRYGGVPPYPETQTYVRRILTRVRR